MVINSEPNDVSGEILKTHRTIKPLNKTISNLQMELAPATAAQKFILSGSTISKNLWTMTIALWEADFYVNLKMMYIAI